jgi:hypothetical protein
MTFRKQVCLGSPYDLLSLWHSADHTVIFVFADIFQLLVVTSDLVWNLANSGPCAC